MTTLCGATRRPLADVGAVEQHRGAPHRRAAPDAHAVDLEDAVLEAVRLEHARCTVAPSSKREHVGIDDLGEAAAEHDAAARCERPSRGDTTASSSVPSSAVQDPRAYRPQAT